MLCGAAGAADDGRLKLATTTSLYDTKLLDLIEQKFEESTMYHLTSSQVELE